MSQKKVGFRNVHIFLVSQVPDRRSFADTASENDHKFLMKISKTHFSSIHMVVHSMRQPLRDQMSTQLPSIVSGEVPDKNFSLYL